MKHSIRSCLTYKHVRQNIYFRVNDRKNMIVQYTNTLLFVQCASSLKTYNNTLWIVLAWYICWQYTFIVNHDSISSSTLRLHIHRLIVWSMTSAATLTFSASFTLTVLKSLTLTVYQFPAINCFTENESFATIAFTMLWC